MQFIVYSVVDTSVADTLTCRCVVYADVLSHEHNTHDFPDACLILVCGTHNP